jgi:hypothetical protein
LGDNQLGGRVVEVVNLGALFQYVVDAADGRMTMVEVNRAGAALRPGDAVTLLFRADDGVLLRGLPRASSPATTESLDRSAVDLPPDGSE